MAAVSAALAVAIGVLSLPGPQASAGELRDKQKHAHRQVEKADEALEESSAALRRATQALSRTREDLVEARAELGDVRARLQIAQQQDEEMKAALAAAEARLAQAQADVAAGKTALTTQQELVVDTITDIYEQGDPSLLAFTSILNAQTPSDITRQREANSSLILRQDNEYDDLRAAEVLLKVHENEVQEATAEVAEQRQEAADHLVEMQQLTQEALDAKENVKTKVGDRKAAEEMAAKAKRLDRKALAKAKQQEARIQKLIQEAIRKARERARERARRAAAAAAAKANHGGAPIDTNGLLMRPVNGPLTSSYGYRVHPIYHYWGLHDGDDFGAPCGAPLYAVANGTVMSQYYSSVWGNRLYINLGLINGKNVTVIYNHLSAYRSSVGQHVTRGQIVGLVGTTGWSTGCHTHFTVMVNGQPVNPTPWFG